MLKAFLQILAVTGTLAAFFLGILLVFMLLVLFFPISYRIHGKKDEAGVMGRVKADWLFGILRLRGSYPVPGKLTVKLLWFTLSGPGKGRTEKAGTGKAKKGHRYQKRKKSRKTPVQESSADQTGEDTAQDRLRDIQTGMSDTSSKTAVQTEEVTSGQSGFFSEEPAEDRDPKSEDKNCKEHLSRESGGAFWFSEKIAKIKYTFLGIYDKIKEIWENISYYIKLFQEEETRQCLSRAGRLSRKILHHIRPRKCKADIVFGTGSPDLTGYLYGAYCMISPSLGKGITVTPAFMETVLMGQVDLKGRIAVAVLLVNGLKLFLDENFKSFIRKLKTGRK